jgi:hypothetical protein
MSYLSYSGWKKFKSCPLAYWHQYIEKTPIVDDRLNTIYGSLVGLMFEKLYNESLWQLGTKARYRMAEMAEPELEKLLVKETAPNKMGPGGLLKWKGSGPDKNRNGMYASKESLLKDVRETVERGIGFIKHHGLLSPRAAAEVKLDTRIEGHKIAGRIDLLAYREAPYSDIVIIDGKGTKYRGSSDSTDVSQLIWYAMLYRQHHKRLPDKVGFLYWRTPENRPEEAVEWHEITEKAVDDLRFDALMTVVRIDALQAKLGLILDQPVVQKIFQPKPSKSSCRFCPYGKSKQLCLTGVEFLQAEAKAARSRKVSLPMYPLPEGDGFSL